MYPSRLKNSLLSTSIFTLLTFMSTLSFAQSSGNIGVVSDYYARGLDQTGGVSVQGALNYNHSSGLYIGSFASNVKWYDKTGDGRADSDIEWDFYTGYADKISENLGFDVGLYYLNYPNQTKYNTYEIYAGLNYQLQSTWPTVFSSKVYFTPDRNAYLPDPKNQDESAWYVTTQADIQLKEGVTLTPQIGYAFGDTFDQASVGGLEEFFNYSIALSKSLPNGFTAKFSYVATDLPQHDSKVILGLSHNFSF